MTMSDKRTCIVLGLAMLVSYATAAKPTSNKNNQTNSYIDESLIQPKNYDFLPYVLKIGAFNIQTFGRSKMSDPVVARRIADIVRRYDVLLIQEIRDISGEALLQLLELVGGTEYSMVYSARLGRSSYKEQYAYFYKITRIALIDAHQYNDGPSDPYEREPFSVRMRPIGGAWDFALSALHAKPADAVNEIRELINVYSDLRKHWSDVEDIILMGDFNADCSYAKESELNQLQIHTDSIFYWPLGMDADTTTSTNTNCAYDRFVVTGPNIRPSVIPGSEGIFQYELAEKLSYDEMRAISDHYPIELELY